MTVPKTTNANFVRDGFSISRRSELTASAPPSSPWTVRRLRPSCSLGATADYVSPADQGHVHHVGVRAGQVANRIITVGDPARLRRFARFLDPDPKPFENVSARGYTVITGRYKGVPVSLIAIGMGASVVSYRPGKKRELNGFGSHAGVAMVDFFVREVRAIVEGDIAIIRSVSPSLAQLLHTHHPALSQLRFLRLARPNLARWLHRSSRTRNAD